MNISPLRQLSTPEKALRLNLDNRIYGSFAEIGAGQEVAAQFFKAGGASGTVAKTMSAYDMAFSDAIYGKCSRYVCEERLLTMLEKEFSLLEKRLPDKAVTTNFFTFANTVEMLNYRKTNQGQGWLGLRFQLSPQSPPNDCIVHVLLHDNDSLLQQYALGIVGVNLIYGCFYLSDEPEVLLTSLVDNLAHRRVEIDLFRLSGPQFSQVDNRLLSLALVKHDLTDATMFGPDGQVCQPSETLYKKNILVLRSRFRPVTHVTIDILTTGLAQFTAEEKVNPAQTVVLSELTLKNLTDHGAIDHQDFLDRVDILCSLGQTVLISDYEEYYKLAAYLYKISRQQKIGFLLGIESLVKIFDESYYSPLPGGILEAFGILFGRDVTLYIYPLQRTPQDELQTCHNFEVSPPLAGLWAYLRTNHKLEDLTPSDPTILSIFSDKVLEMIQADTPGWEQMVPHQVAEAIKTKHLFHYGSGPHPF